MENGAFQQETNPGPKQSESELYFGDVSSCCGPESSFYDLAVEKEGTTPKCSTYDQVARRVNFILSLFSHLYIINILLYLKKILENIRKRIYRIFH